MCGYSILISVLLLLPFNTISLVTNKTACDLLKLPRDCRCQRTRGVPISSLNETRLRCRQLTKITADYRWSIVPYDRLAFESPNDNLTLSRFAFADIRARTIRFNAQNLFLNGQTFYNGYIGQLAISHTNNYGLLNFETNGEVFFSTTITNIYIKTMNFQRPISEIIFDNSRIYSLIIQSSLFYGFTNKNLPIQQKSNETKRNLLNQTEHDNFLEYDLMSTRTLSQETSDIQTLPLKVRRKKKTKDSHDEFEYDDDNSSNLPDQTIIMNVTSKTYPAFITIYTVHSSINTTNLTENYFPINIEYSQTDEIELTYNFIQSIGAHAFRHLKYFEGHLILTHNNIEYISSEAFHDLNLLNNLSLANNLIENLTSVHFQYLRNLHKLDLSSNQIHKLDENLFEHLLNLKILYLNNNPLKFIDPNIFNNLVDLKELHLKQIQLTYFIDPQYYHWIWNIANIHVNYLDNTNFDLSDIAFCLLSRYNQTLFHLSRQQSCSCNLHYLYFNSNNQENQSHLHMKQHYSNYLRLTPICINNETITIYSDDENVNHSNKNDFLLSGLDDKCDYRLHFLDCDAITTTPPINTDVTTSFENLNQTTLEMTTTTLWYYKYTKAPKESVGNTKKLFTVLGTLAAITIIAIILVILWYRAKTYFKQKRKKKKLEQQSQFNLSSNNYNNHPNQTRYASSEMLSSIHSANLISNKNQPQVFLEPTSSPTAPLKLNEMSTNDSIKSYIDDESLNPSEQHKLSNDDKTIELESITRQTKC